MIKPKTREKKLNPLSADYMFNMIRDQLTNIPDHRPMNVKISLVDNLMSGFSLFSLKDPSLLAFDTRRHESAANLKRLYGIDRIPCDTQMRKVLDGVNPSGIRPAFKRLREHAQQTGMLQQMKYDELGGYYPLALDGTGYFNSKKVYCDHCMEKHHKKSGETTYYHQMLAAAIVCPGKKEVLPLLSEPIMKQDGNKKNDCERNATKRLLEKIRADHPDLPFIVIEDALSANAPHIAELKRHDFRFVLGAKPKGNKFLFKQMADAVELGTAQECEVVQNGVTHRFRFLNDASLNDSNQEIKVNFLQYWELKGGKVTRKFSWITDITITINSVMALMKVGRARWKIENETFNTLKNQGYHFEHNFGHGKQFLSTVLANLLLLAFGVDQLQQMGCELFQKALKKVKTKRLLWERMRSFFHEFPLENMSDIWRAIVYGFQAQIIIYDEDD